MPILRISRGKISTGTWDEFEAAYRKAIDAAGSVPGLISRSLSRNYSDFDEGISMSVWEDDAAVKAYEESELAKTVSPLLQPFFTGDYRFDHFEIRYWDDPSKR